MKSINEASQENVELIDTYVDAQSLREITLTPEQLFENKKKNVCDGLMETMVKMATTQGKNFYAVNLFEDFYTDEKLVKEIIEVFSDLGYNVNLSEPMQNKEVGPKSFKMLVVDWRELEASQEQKEEDVSN
jgi:hypothetical protein